MSMAEKVLEKIGVLLSDLERERNSSGGNEEQNKDIESVMARLYPSGRSQGGERKGMSRPRASASRKASTGESPSVSVPTQTKHQFKPYFPGDSFNGKSYNSNYDPRVSYKVPIKKKRRLGFSNVKKCDEDSRLLKDIILIPNPEVDVVPRGSVRSSLYKKGFVLMAAELQNNWSEKETKEYISERFAKNFKEKFMFEFVRAVGDSLVTCSGTDWSVKVIKHMTQKNPLYIRSYSVIESPHLIESGKRKGLSFALDGTKHDSDTESDYEVSDDDGLENPLPCLSGIEKPKICVDEAKPILDTNDFKKEIKIEEKTQPVNSHKACDMRVDSETTTEYESVSREQKQPNLNQTEASNVLVGPSCSSYIECPICSHPYPSDIVQYHVNLCADQQSRGSTEIRFENLISELTQDDHKPFEVSSDQSEDEEVKTSQINLTVKDILKELASKVKKEKEKLNRLNVRRKFIWEDFVAARKKKWFKTDGLFKVHFMDEQAVDDGGPRREFFSETMDRMRSRLFESSTVPNELVPAGSTFALQDKEYLYAGELMATSIVQGGPAPSFFAPWVYMLICEKLEMDNVSLPWHLLREGHPWKSSFDKINQCQSDGELQKVLTTEECMNILTSIGYRKVASKETLRGRSAVVRSILFKAVLEPILPMILQIQNGLESYGVLDKIKMHTELFKPLFVYSEDNENTIDSQKFLDSLLIMYSETGSNAKEKEVNTYKYFCDILEEFDHGFETEIEGEQVKMTVERVYKFVTGCTTIPPLGLPEQISIAFKHSCVQNCNCLPTTSTCALEITLPTHIQSFEKMKEAMISALIDGQGFGVV